MSKSTVNEIRKRFDNDVERFSNLETGQSATVDAALAMALLTEAAAAVTPQARHVLDIGCGAGNYTLKLLQWLPDLDTTLIDLSQPMLERAVQRVRKETTGVVIPIQGDIRETALESEAYDIALAAAVLHHLRTPAEWELVFRKIFRALRPGGSFWVFDMVQSLAPEIQAILWKRYGQYLSDFRGEVYRDHVFSYIEQEDTPQSLPFQLNLMRQAGFEDADILHKNCCFAAFGGRKPAHSIRRTRDESVG